jgi:acyl transferase domain-containing protein/phosphopantetheinyl transferase
MPEPVAIVGMAAVFPGAPDLRTYWSNIERGVDAIGDVPAARWDPVYFDPASTSIDRFYCRRGGFVEPTFDPIAFGIMPVAASGAEPDQLLALQTAANAVDDAGYGPGRPLPRDRTGVILGRGGYLTPGMARLSNQVRTAQQLVTALAELVPDLDAATLDRIRGAFQARSGELGPEHAIGLVPNLAASRIANRLDLRGPAYTIDAACASSLLAVDHGCRELADGRCDLIVAGGVHVCHDVTLWSVFTQLGALSRNQAIRPFDRRADGILIGEGAGIVVLKRLADAERDGDRIYAVIRGTGVSSDGRESSAMRPRAEGQLAAIDAAWRAAGRDPSTVGLVEAHGTATPAGDEIELAALAQFFGETTGPRAAIGSVKSMIGHAMPAAGAAGLIKAALAIHHGVQPPSLHCEQPHEALARTRFRVLGQAEPWSERAPLAGISAFGFGGINAHVVIEAPHARSERRTTGAARVAASDPRPQILAVAGDTIDRLRDALDTGRAGTGAMRLAVLDPTPERRALAHKVLDRGRAWRGNHDIWFAPRGLAADGGKLAFVFPGVEATFAVNAGDVARELGVALPPAIVTAAATTASTPRELEQRGTGVFALGRLLATAMARIGIAPDAIAGHSLGEWTGMVASEMIPPGDVESFVASLPAGSLEVPDVVFAAVGCGAAGAEAVLDGLDAIAVSHDNCPHQSVVCGRRDRVRTAIERLGARGVLCQELPFRSGFHSPLLAEYLGLHRAHLAQLALQRPRVPLWSATTCAPYPDEPAAIRALAIEHLVRPVRFRELVEQLYAAGVRAFVQLGVGSVAGFVDDTLRGRDYLAVTAATAKHSGMSQLARVVAALYVDGFADDVELELGASTSAGSLRSRPDDARAPAKPRSTMTLELGAPLVRLGGSVPPLSVAGLPRAAGVADPVLAELLATLDEAAAASRAVVDAYRATSRAPSASHAAAAAAPRPRTVTVRRTLSVDTVPALIDHTFYRQPADWPCVADRYPVVPMTMNLRLMADAACALAPGRVAIALEDVRAFRWLAVAPAVDVEITATARDADRVDVEIAGYARATVRLADGFPAAPEAALAPLANPRATPVTAERLYADRWMFHGSQYQGVVAMGPMGDDGVDGTIEVLPAPGALLDCAGQLMGWWVMNHERADRLAMPVKIDRVALFGPEPGVGERVACSVRMRHLGPREVRADLELVAGGRVWARVDGWEDRRFDSDDPVWAVLMYPESNALAVAHDGHVVVTEHWQGAASRELMMRRYLGERERADHERLGPRARRGWLLGRIALKDAVRQHLWAGGAGALFPVEVEVHNEPSGRPVINTPFADDLRVSVAHKDDVAVAIVGDCRDVGIDIERIAPRTDGFIAVAFVADELALIAGRDRDEWMTRLWTAKEAVAKARATGLKDPKQFVVRAIDGERLTIDDDVVDTRRDGDHVIAWTRRSR